MRQTPKLKHVINHWIQGAMRQDHECGLASQQAVAVRRDPDNRDFWQVLGADVCVTLDTDDARKFVRALRGADGVSLACPDQEACQEGWDCLEESQGTSWEEEDRWLALVEEDAAGW